MRRPILGGWLLVLAAVVGLPATLRAQEAVLMGTIADTTGAVLPGVTVSAMKYETLVGQSRWAPAEFVTATCHCRCR
jgi:hypothetical protein